MGGPNYKKGSNNDRKRGPIESGMGNLVGAGAGPGGGTRRRDGHRVPRQIIVSSFYYTENDRRTKLTSSFYYSEDGRRTELIFVTGNRRLAFGGQRKPGRGRRVARWRHPEARWPPCTPRRRSTSSFYQIDIVLLLHKSTSAFYYSGVSRRKSSFGVWGA